MNDLLLNAAAVGLRDGLNPCMFMTAAVLISLKDVFGRKVYFWRCFFFSQVFALSFLSFTFGPAQVLVLQKPFVLGAKVVYAVLSLWTLAKGLWFMKDWYAVVSGRYTDKDTHQPHNRFLVYLSVVFIAILMSALANLWPVDKYIIVLGNEALLHAQFKEIMPMLLVYVLSSMWAIWLVWALLSITSLRLSLRKIICAAVFLSASTCLIFIFR